MTKSIEDGMKILKTILLGAALVLPAWGAIAAEMPVGHFVRVYDSAHLTAHPDQLVKEVDLKLKRSSTDKDVRDFSLRMKLRGRVKALTTAGFCLSEGSGLKCIVECDGGGVRIAAAR